MNEKQNIYQPRGVIYNYSIILETKHSKEKNKRGVVSVRSCLSYIMQKTNGAKCEKLCYSGQRCQKIPETLIKLYGQKVQCLDISYNELTTLRGLEGFTELKELILDNNQLTDSLVLPYLPQLYTLSLNKNKINDIESLLAKINQNCPRLNYLSLLGNKACPNELSGNENNEEDYQRYRCYVLYLLPNLKFLDSNKVRESERSEAKRRGKFMNIIRPRSSNVGETPFNNSSTNNLTPLPKAMRNPNDHKGSFIHSQ
ncbi:hypothetical protein JTB14_028905 [Gonioctena quinquepunctata]|nr:hypothetical protein JTB14_028905 [Gonioctena quinquepunctata]